MLSTADQQTCNLDLVNIKTDSNSRDKLIPPNDPKTPRWLLDLHDWKLERYIDVARTVETEGYGIVSYTWGYIADLEKPQPDDKLPGGLLWDVPATSGFSLRRAREVMSKIGTRYVWWDWMNIYRNAKKSIVWLHSTDCSLKSPLKTLLLAGSKDNGTLPTEPKAYFDKIVQLLTESRKLERWFVSGWALQEGVLLPETILIDGASNALQHDTFMHNGGNTSVIDLTARVTKLAIEVAQSFLLQANGKAPQNQVGILIDESAHMANDFRQILRALVTSGLVAYAKASPLYILSDKQSRKFGMVQDSCWALIGAMELENATVDYKLPMDEIKRIFLTALFEKYRWSMLLLPQPFFSASKGQSANGFRWINIVDGLLIPVGVFVDSQIGLASQSMLPRISLDNAMTYLHYVQTEAGFKIRSPASKTNPTPHISDAVFLKLEDLGKNDKAITTSTGMRCVAIMGFGAPQIKESAGVFGGIVDLWFAGGSKVEVSTLKLHSSAP
ncbi:hypothetical protein BHYA_0145g00290 [Botrytis hyacinthi]|uniref:Heterokaryon incompatibility domain-containing protein n=1 Tax=Botrytis hyacinthi TaxID=278943 RepID=A0A4Z1GQE5_9HELO|nr:hypothetical protein BHYA_0145g00290 [Botrytis hyacinthi]